MNELMNEWTSEWMNERMNKWTNECMNEWINELMNEWKSELMNEWMNELTNEWTCEWMNERMNEWINEWTNEWMNERVNELVNDWMNIPNCKPSRSTGRQCWYGHEKSKSGCGILLPWLNNTEKWWSCWANRASWTRVHVWLTGPVTGGAPSGSPCSVLFLEKAEIGWTAVKVHNQPATVCAPAVSETNTATCQNRLTDTQQSCVRRLDLFWFTLQYRRNNSTFPHPKSWIMLRNKDWGVLRTV
jgi:hypothetical protein